MSEHLLKELEKRYCFTYDKKTNTIKKLNGSYDSQLLFKELIFIVNLLESCNIDYHVDKDENIELIQ